MQQPEIAFNRELCKRGMFDLFVNSFYNVQHMNDGSVCVGFLHKEGF